MYKTKSGDAWDSIAKNELGNEKYAEELFYANFNKINSETIVFSEGVELIIPEIVVENTFETPPWRR